MKTGDPTPTPHRQQNVPSVLNVPKTLDNYANAKHVVLVSITTNTAHEPVRCCQTALKRLTNTACKTTKTNYKMTKVMLYM